MTPEITMLYVHAERIGYGRMGKMIADTLTSRGVKVWDADGRPEEYRRIEISEHANYEASPTPTNALSLMSVPTHLDGRYSGQHLSILTMWESRVLPPAFRETMHEYDLVMVPSHHNVELFSRYHPNVEFVSLGVDDALWYPIPVTLPTTTFDFLISGRGSRKGVDLAYRAFRTVFSDPDKFTPTPRLIMKSFQGHGDYYGKNVVHTTGVLEPEAERDLYASAHCYLQPSRGEGFGLQPLQAMALGRPTILTNAHGHESFAGLGLPISAGASKADYFIYGDAGEWWEPDFEELCEQMWDVYSNYERHVAKAEESASFIASTLTWNNTTDRYVELLGGEMGKPYVGSGEWVAPVAKRYPVRVIRPWTGEIAGFEIAMEPGITYWQYADVLRILFDNGVLDPTCLEEDEDGLLPAQVEQLGLYQGEHSWCPTCHQKLNSGIKRSDAIFAELEAAARVRNELVQSIVASGIEEGVAPETIKDFLDWEAG